MNWAKTFPKDPFTNVASGFQRSHEQLVKKKVTFVPDSEKLYFKKNYIDFSTQGPLASKSMSQSSLLPASSSQGPSSGAKPTSASLISRPLTSKEFEKRCDELRKLEALVFEQVQSSSQDNESIPFVVSSLKMPRVIMANVVLGELSNALESLLTEIKAGKEEVLVTLPSSQQKELEQLIGRSQAVSRLFHDLKSDRLSFSAFVSKIEVLHPNKRPPTPKKLQTRNEEVDLGFLANTFGPGQKPAFDFNPSNPLVSGQQGGNPERKKSTFENFEEEFGLKKAQNEGKVSLEDLDNISSISKHSAIEVNSRGGRRQSQIEGGLTPSGVGRAPFDFGKEKPNEANQETNQRGPEQTPDALFNNIFGGGGKPVQNHEEAGKAPANDPFSSIDFNAMFSSKPQPKEEPIFMEQEPRNPKMEQDPLRESWGFESQRLPYDPNQSPLFPAPKKSPASVAIPEASEQPRSKETKEVPSFVFDESPANKQRNKRGTELNFDDIFEGGASANGLQRQNERENNRGLDFLEGVSQVQGAKSNEMNLSFLNNSVFRGGNIDQMAEEKENLQMMIDQEKQKADLLDGMLAESIQKNQKKSQTSAENARILNEIKSLERELAIWEQIDEKMGPGVEEQKEKEIREVSLKIQEVQREIQKTQEEITKLEREKRNNQANSGFNPHLVSNGIKTPMREASHLGSPNSVPFQRDPVLLNSNQKQEQSSSVRVPTDFSLKQKGTMDSPRMEFLSKSLLVKTSELPMRNSDINGGISRGSQRPSDVLLEMQRDIGPKSFMPLSDSSGSDFLAKFNSELNLVLKDSCSRQYHPQSDQPIAARFRPSAAQNDWNSLSSSAWNGQSY